MEQRRFGLRADDLALTEVTRLRVSLLRSWPIDKEESVLLRHERRGRFKPYSRNLLIL